MLQQVEPRVNQAEEIMQNMNHRHQNITGRTTLNIPDVRFANFANHNRNLMEEVNSIESNFAQMEKHRARTWMVIPFPRSLVTW